MTSSNDSDCLDQDENEYEIMFRHTEQGFKYRKDVLAKLRRSNSGASRKGRDTRSESSQSRFSNSRREILHLECQIEELNEKYAEAKCNYVARHKELESLRAHLEKLGQEICEYDSTAGKAGQKNSFSGNDDGKLLKKEVIVCSLLEVHELDIVLICACLERFSSQNFRRMHDEISKKLVDELSTLDKELSTMESDLQSKEARLEALLGTSTSITSRDRASATELLTSLDKEISAGKRLREADASLERLESFPAHSDSFASTAALQVRRPFVPFPLPLPSASIVRTCDPQQQQRGGRCGARRGGLAEPRPRAPSDGGRRARPPPRARFSTRFSRAPSFLFEYC